MFYFQKMNTVARLFGNLTTLPTRSVIVTSSCSSFISRGFTSLVSSSNTRATVPALVTQTVQVQQRRDYKVRHVLKKRCAGCYFEKRFGRLYIECSLRARHKQMQLVSGYGLFKDDYSTKNWKRAVHWGYRANGKLHKWGDSSQYSKFNWLEGRLGTDV